MLITFRETKFIYVSPSQMTSLASQLQRLAVPYTQTVLGADKRRVSLLFNPKDAAELDRQAVYAIGKWQFLETLSTSDSEFLYQVPDR